MDTLELFRLLIALFSFPVAFGLVFAILLQPIRTRTSWFFALYGGAVALWAFGILIQFVDDFPLLSLRQQYWVQLTGLVLALTTFFGFVASFTAAKHPVVRGLAAAAFIISPISIAMVWAGWSVEWSPDEQPITTVGYVMLTLGIFYLVASNVLLWVRRDERSRAIQLPAFLMLVGMSSNFIPALSALPFDTFMNALALAMMGWQVTYFQVVNPMLTTNQELQRRNEDLLVLNRELTAQKERMAALNEQLRQASAYKSEFLANMSHELRTPLNAIIGYSTLLLQKIYGEITPEQMDRIEKVNRNGKNLLALINDILDLSKIEAGRLEIHPQPMTMAEVLDDLIPNVEPLVSEKGLQFITDIDSNLHPIYADSVRLRQVLLNLLSNAVKFTPQGKITLRMKNVTIKDGKCDLISLPNNHFSDGKWVIASVEDTGIGIESKHQAHIFEEFRQVDSSATREYGGTGLGLAIAKRLIEMQSGSIWMSSKVGEGSQFYIALPAYESALPAPSDPSAPTVLVIEDSREAADILNTHLSRAGYCVVWAAGGKAGLEEARKLQPDIITVDIMMPGMTGWEVIAHLKEDPATAHIPLVIVSVLNERPHGLEVGASDYVVKPIERDKLLKALQRVQSQIPPDQPILIVEDDPAEREILSTYLSNAGYKSEQVPDGEAALRWLEESASLPALILLDLMMPKISGFAVLQHIRSSPKLMHLPVLIVTAKTLEPAEQEFLSAHTTSILAKHGLTDTQLIAQIRAMLAAQKATP